MIRQKRVSPLVGRAAAAGALALAIGVGSAHAAVIVSDSFVTGGTPEYTAGDRLGDASGNPTGFDGGWAHKVGNVASSVDLRISGTGLTHAGVDSSGGSIESYRNGTAGSSQGLLYTTNTLTGAPQVTPGTDVYFSALVNLNAGILGGVGVEFKGREMFGVGIDEDGHGVIYLSSSNTTAFAEIAETVGTYTADTTYLVVGKMVGVSGGLSGDAETIELVGIYASGDALVEGASLLSSASDVYYPSDATNVSGNVTGQTVQRAGAFLGKSLGDVDGRLDEIRLGTSFEDVVVIPEPGAMALVAFGALSMFARPKKS